MSDYFKRCWFLASVGDKGAAKYLVHAVDEAEARDMMSLLAESCEFTCLTWRELVKILDVVAPTQVDIDDYVRGDLMFYKYGCIVTIWGDKRERGD